MRTAQYPQTETTPMNAKTPLALAMTALMLCATTACNRDHDADDTNAPAATADTAASEAATPADTMPAAPADTTAPAAAMPTQQEALALLNLVNDHEVKAAEQAMSKKVTGDVAAYADMMKTEHGKNMDATKSLLDKNGGAPADTAAMTDMKSKGEAEMQQLAALDGDAYAKAYIDAMVAGHQDALTKLDTMLIPAATDAAIKQHLQATRDAVQKHLDRAKELQAKLAG
jgi:predicted outer membrane protein